ncbi:MAG: PKD domain-containing protein [Phycisphaerae bacterium]|nr:PKD domain-containing protein [Phycisphaerae bacterium]
MSHTAHLYDKCSNKASWTLSVGVFIGILALGGMSIGLVGCGAKGATQSVQADTLSDAPIAEEPGDDLVGMDVEPGEVKRSIRALPTGDENQAEWVFNITGMPAEERATYMIEWDFGDGATTTGDNVQHVFPAPGEYPVSVTATDPYGGTAYTLAVVAAVDVDPTQTGGKLLALMEGHIDYQANVAVLTATAKTSALEPGETVRFDWEFANGTRADGDKVSHEIPVNTPYKVNVTAETSQGRTADYQKFFTATNHQAPTGEIGPIKDDPGSTPTEPPGLQVVANAGADQEAKAGSKVTLDGSGSSAPEGTPALFFWRQTSGPTVGIESPNAPVAWFTAPSAEVGSVTLVFKLSVVQGGLEDTDEARVVVLNDGASIDEPPSSDPPSNAQLLAWMQELDPLPKVHYSWAVHVDMMGDPPDPLLVEYVRITRAISLWANQNATRIDSAVSICQQVNQGDVAIPASIAVVYTPWHIVFPPEAPPTYVGPEHYAEIDLFRERLTNIRRWLADANAAHGTNIQVTALLLDTEKFRIKSETEEGYQEWNTAMNVKYDSFFLAGKDIFPDATIEWFQRGQVRKPFFTLEEMGDTFACSVYNGPDMETSRETIRATCENAHQHGVEDVTVWVGLAYGWLTQDGPLEQNWNYDVSASWQLGFEINNPSPANPMGQPALLNMIRFVSFFPKPFQVETPYWGKHFVAYVRGAHGIAELP